MTGVFCRICRAATVWLDRGVTRRLDRGFGEFEAWRDSVLEQEERDAAKARPQDRRRGTLAALWRHGAAQAQREPPGGLPALRQATRGARRRRRGQDLASPRARFPAGSWSRPKRSAKSLWRAAIVKDFSTAAFCAAIGLASSAPNGAGKTTLIKLLTGVLEPDQGTVRLGANLQMATLDQRRASLDPDATLADTLTGGGSDCVEINGERKHVIGYMKDFLFPPEQARTPIGQAVRRRARPADAGAGLGAAVELARARRADQRSRSRDARSAAGNAGRLSRHDPAGQP